MTPDRWQRVASVFEAASELPADERTVFLRNACGDDEALREEVQSLLASAAVAGDFLTAGAMGDTARALAEEPFLSLTGHRLGHYEVLSLIGSGGMGEVYRARDPRLRRDVAIKVLPALLTRSADARRRFEREARAVAALSHPSIRSLYDVGESHGRVYAVMELLEGETLRARLDRGPLALRKAVDMAAATADGLAAAHAKGIVHRDLKPENVFITTDGQVKVLDFGLAKTQEPAAPEDLDRQMGQYAAAGTPAYMSPEQVSGSNVDTRSDLFSFGSVLYEMVSGRRAFHRPTAPQTLAAILNEEPPELDALNVEIRRIVAHCLEKEPQARFQSAQDLAFCLRGLSVSDVGGRRALPRHPGRAAWLVGTGTISVIIAITAWLVLRHDPAKMIQSHLMPPPNVIFNLELGLAISPDGRRLAYTARSIQDTNESLWVQPLDGSSAQRLAGTEGGRFPFWAPDSRSLAFFSGNALMRIDSSGGVPQRLCSPCGVGQGAWSSQDVIVFGGVHGGGLRGVPASGGDPFPATELDSTRGEEAHGLPVFLRDGRYLLFQTIANSDSSVRGIYGTALGSKRTTLVSTTSGVAGRSRKVHVADGHLLFMQDGRLMAAPFDEAGARLKGETTAIADNIGAFSVSAAGILVYAQRAVTELAWFDRSGRQIEAPTIRGDFSVPTLSHDGRRIAVASFGERDATDIWLYDVASGTGFALTNHPGHDGFPLWSPNDEWVMFHSDRTGRYELYRKRSTGDGTEERVLARDSPPWATSWARDGSLILSDSRPANEDLWKLRPGKNPSLLLQTPFKEWAGQVSPDDRWIAYNSNETGQAEIYVQAFPPSGEPRRVSANGGIWPKWRRDGSELFFMDTSNRKMMVAEVRPEPTFQAGAPRPLFDLTMMRHTATPRVAHFDVSADGQRFLIVRIPPDAGMRPLTIVQNWTAALKK